MDHLSASNLCRCCLAKEENILIDLTENYFDEKLLAECFQTITGISLQDLGSCSKICELCEVEFKNAYKFRKKAIEAHERLFQIKLECVESVLETEDVTVKLEPYCEKLEEIDFCPEVQSVKRKNRKRRKSSGLDSAAEKLFKSHHEDRIASSNFDQNELRSDGTLMLSECPKRFRKGKKGPKRFECHHCGLISGKKRNLLTHLERMHFKHLKKHLCDNCGQKFTSGAELNVHVRTIHKNEKTYQCNQCPRTYLYLQSLKVHLTSHSDARQFVCEICSASYKARGALFNHKKTHTQPSREYTCKECGNRFTDKPTYEKHVNELHSADKKYCCSECGKRFKSKRSHEDHMRFHIGEFVKCPQCPKEYTTEYKLSKHILFTHSGQEKQFKCHLCPSAFHLISNWKRHLKRVHK